MQARVVADVFSGRENPSWQLDSEQTAEFNRRLAGLAAADTVPGPPALGLGYRGFVVELGDDTVRVADGLVRTRDRVRQDRERELERWLLATAPPELEPAVSRLIAAALSH